VSLPVLFEGLKAPSEEEGQQTLAKSVMPRWLLTPIDHRAEIWHTYAVQRIVVEAPDERRARDPQASLLNPWLDPALTSKKAEKGDPKTAAPHWKMLNSLQNGGSP
jgi:hypothetical protein